MLLTPLPPRLPGHPVKTYNGALGIDVTGKPHTTILELAKKNGKATGNVTTSEIQDATPAALISHISQRKCYGPEETAERCSADALENGGLGSISEQLLNARADVTLGGGAKSFRQTAKAGTMRENPEEQAAARGYLVVKDAKSLADVKAANQDKPVLGLFSDGNMEVAWEGPKASYRGNLDKPVVECKPSSKLDPNAPTLAQMTEKPLICLKIMKTASSYRWKAPLSINRITRQTPAARSAKPLHWMKRYKSVWNTRKTW